MNLNSKIQILPRTPAAHRDALKYNAIGQGFIWLLSAIILDGGRISAMVTIALMAYWCSVFIILVRRYPRVRPTDLIFFRFGFVGTLVLTEMLRSFVGIFV